MAFSLQGFGAGFASKLSQRLDEDRIRQEQLQDEARREATRVRLAKQAQREKDKKIAEETVGMLTMLGYSQESAQAIAGKGVAASEFAIEAGQKALTKGVDPNTIFNFPSVGGEITEASKTTINQTIDAAKPKEIGGFATTKDETSTLVSGTGLNLSVYKDLFAEPDKIESSFSARLAVISQELARNPNGKNAEALKQEQAALLKDLEIMKEAERDKKGEVTESYTLGSVSSTIREVRASSLNRFGFKLGINDEIEGMETGQEYLSDIANIAAVGQLTTRNSKIQSESMNFAIRGLYDSAKVGLADHAFEVNRQGKATQVSTQDFADSAAANQYRIGQVFNDGTNLYVYTGYIDPITGMPFMTYALGG